MKLVCWEREGCREGCMEGGGEHDSRGSTGAHLAMGSHKDVLECIMYD